MLDNGPHLSRGTFGPLGQFVPWDILSVVRFVPRDVLSSGTFCPLGRLGPWDILSVVRFVPRDVLSSGTFCPWDVLSLDVLS